MLMLTPSVSHHGVSAIEKCYRFGPQLIAIALDRFQIDCSAADGPEAPAAGLVLQIRSAFVLPMNTDWRGTSIMRRP